MLPLAWHFGGGGGGGGSGGGGGGSGGGGGGGVHLISLLFCPKDFILHEV